MKYFLSLCIFFFSVNLGLSQIQVSGKVLIESDSIMESMPGTTILEKGTTNQVYSDIDGEFSIKCVTENRL